MKIVTVGTGAPRHFVRSGRICSSTLVEVAGTRILFDCGPGTSVNLMKGEIFPWEIDYLFFTHHHYDHDADYGSFHLIRWDLGGGNAKPLNVFGPEPTERQTEQLFGEDGVFGNDIAARTKWYGHLWAYTDIGGVLPRSGPEVVAKDLFPGNTLEFDGFRVTTGLGVHAQPWVDSLCYRIDSEEGSVVITGDTTSASTVISLAKDADTLVGWTSRSIEPSDTAAHIAAAANVRKLVISHSGLKDFNAKIEEQAKQVFNGPVIMAEDLMEIPVR